MKAVSLLIVLVLAHVMAVLERDVPISAWSLAALFWQDVAVALGFAALDRLLRSAPRVAWGAYAVVVAWTAINVPVARVLSSPLTPSMLRAARGTLLDSIGHYVTFVHVGSILAVGAAGVLAARLSRLRLSRGVRGALVLCGLAVVAAGPYAASRAESTGWERNAVGALWPARAPEGGEHEAGADWRLSPFGRGPRSPELSSLGGAAAGRHVVVVVLESAGAVYLAPWGADRDPMPRLTALADGSLVFETAYAVYPESIRGLLPVLCSIYPAFGVPAASYGDIECPSLAAELSRRGYRTGLFHSGRFAYLGMRAIVEGRGFEVLEDAGDISGNHQSSFGVDEPATLERLFGWIDSLDPDEPFFLTYLPIAGHHPYATPGPGAFPADTEFGRYLNALGYGDQALGALLDGFAARGLDRETLFVIFGDHGEAFGTHEGNFGHSFFIYEANVRIPYVIAAPGLTDRGIRVSEPISVIDTAPTILDLLGLPVPEGYQGASALDGETRVALFFTDYALGWLGLYDDCRKLVFGTDSGRSRLFDVCRDPGERVDRAAAEPDRVQAYRVHVEGWAAAQAAWVEEMRGPPERTTPQP